MNFKCYFIIALFLCILMTFLGVIQGSKIFLIYGLIGTIVSIIILSVINFINNLTDTIDCFNNVINN